MDIVTRNRAAQICAAGVDDTVADRMSGDTIYAKCCFCKPQVATTHNSSFVCIHLLISNLSYFFINFIDILV